MLAQIDGKIDAQCIQCLEAWNKTHEVFVDMYTETEQKAWENFCHAKQSDDIATCMNIIIDEVMRKRNQVTHHPLFSTHCYLTCALKRFTKVQVERDSLKRWNK